VKVDTVVIVTASEIKGCPMTTWMIVEDEPGVYEMLLALSEVMGNDGVAFIDGDEALAWIDDVDAGHYGGELPELAMLDIRLPTEIHGGMVGERIRQSPVLGNMAIILMTAYKLSGADRDMLMEMSGADLYLQKPLPAFRELQALFAEVMAQRTQSRH
jgi:CheY-like chemotaxis protein